MTVTEPAPPDAAIKRDQWGRYLIPHPDTGKQQAWTRATTIAGTLADRYGLEKWDQRNVVLGIGARRDLYAQAAAAVPTDVQTLNQIVDQAKEASKAKAGANMGSALHRLTERHDAGELDPADIADPTLRGDIEAYAQAMEAAGVITVPGWLERVLIVPEIDAAGTCDRLTNGFWPLPRIGDVKTGKDVVNYGMAEIPLQLAIYSHASHWYDPATGELHDMPRIDRNRAIVMHLPAGQGRCTLYEINIEAGWEAVQLAVDVRNWRKRKGLAQQLPAIAPVPVDLEVRVDWARTRVQTVIEHGGGTTLAQLWSARPDVPTFKQGGPTSHPHVDAIAAMCDEAEKAHEIPFGPSDPMKQPATKATQKARATA